MTFRYSFVVLAYNQQDSIAEAMRAALAQDCPPIEVLISDDCSTDCTFEIMQEIAREYDGPHKLVLNRNPENLGINRHVNLSVEMSNGEVIIAASGDDISLPNRVAQVMGAFESEGAMLVHSRAIVEDEQGNHAYHPYAKRAAFFRTTRVEDVASARALYLGATAAWHKALYHKYGPIPEAPVYEDLILGFRAALAGGGRLIDEPLVRYRIGGGITTTKTLVQNANEIRALRQQFLERTRNVLITRLADLELYGASKYPGVHKKLKKRIAFVDLRLIANRDGAMATLKQGNSLLALSAVLAELNAHRKAHKNLKSA